MLGLGDFWVSSVFILCILSTLLCVVYGAIKWNSDDQDDGLIQEEEKKWEEEERQIEDNL